MGHKILMQELESHSGIQSVIWGKESEELLVFSGHSVITTGFSVPLMRLCVSSGRSAKVLEDGDRMLLVGNDKILVHRVDFQQQYDLLQRDYGWDLINIPPEYVQENWPIRYAEISKDGKRVVVAGTRGFVIYDYNVAKWKLFLKQLVANPYNVVKIRCIEKIPGSQSVVVALQEGINIKIVHHSGSSGDKTPFTEVKIRNKAEAFGIVSIKNLDNNPTIWWYDGDTLNSAALSMRHFQSPDIEKPATSQVLEMRQLSECGYSGLEFYPTTLSSQRGLIIGLEHTQAIRNSFVGGFTPVRCKTIFFLSDIVRFIFMSRPLEAAVQACSSYLGYPYFNICLEMLLLDSISSDSEKLEQVVSFISKFKVFHQVIAHTARKTEMKLWAMLFKYTNTPSEIFLDCLNKNDVKTAMQLLIVLHNMESTDVFEYLSLCLLDCAERNHDGVACLEILTFVKQLKQNDTFGYLDGLV
ncbi:RAB6A-GEF complex partner protein 1 [Zancudomyces culisetae]|uniref:RAB6A-GEF complex partner protein 1 n=1 Tax=Zancudomyces culisetae TaxID=1213189 RepID=A0A1R1PZ27_ZANCU|nr:RAB6A-GEF complex partner protein 1 [Zancudomyces culisetae]|eukprot:OMH86195.1 RAB6A-GEF complex partner protein 1 [Zancudomyces culisetae]